MNFINSLLVTAFFIPGPRIDYIFEGKYSVDNTLKSPIVVSFTCGPAYLPVKVEVPPGHHEVVIQDELGEVLRSCTPLRWEKKRGSK